MAMEYTTLTERIQRLELELNADGRQDLVVSQLANIKGHLTKLYNSNSELVTLNRIVNDLKLGPKPPVPDTEGIDAKQEILLLKYPAIKEAYNNLIELANMETDKIINYVDSTQIKIHDFDSDRETMVSKQAELKQVVKMFHQMVVKNMIVFEKYVDLLIRENNFWISVDERLGKLEEKVHAWTKERELSNKY